MHLLRYFKNNFEFVCESSTIKIAIFFLDEFRKKSMHLFLKIELCIAISITDQTIVSRNA